MMDPNLAAPGYWRYLINPDKSATPQFEQLCLGIAKVIATLEPGPGDELSPSRLAIFYRTVGGNYDSLFLKSSDSALSFMYQTLGCFHSLQPTASPFETPRIPCLTPLGFAHWQRVQLLLCPDENMAFIQKAVQRWNVPTPTGGIYPKYVPKDVFPDRPDEEMERWHREVTGKLNQQNYNNMPRIKNSPYQSPHPEPHDRRDGYFGAQVVRPARPSRSSSRDDDQLAALHRRRSSVPDFPSPSGERGSHWDSRNQQDAKKARSHSAQRPENPPTRQRSQTTTGPPSHQKTPSDTSSSSNRRHGTAPPESSGRRSSGYNTKYRSPARTPSTVDEDTGSEGSSETSQADRRQRKSDEDRKSRRSSLWPPSFMRSSHKRRHSSDAGYRAPGPKSQAPSQVPPLPPRPESNQPRAIKPSPLPQSHHRGPTGAPQWRENVWDNESARSPATPTQAQVQMDPRAPSLRYPDQSTFEPLTRESSSGSDHRHRSSDWEKENARRRQVQAAPRVATMTGVSGRKYPTSDTMSPIERQRTHPPRGGVPTMV